MHNHLMVKTHILLMETYDRMCRAMKIVIMAEYLSDVELTMLEDVVGETEWTIDEILKN